MFMIVALVYVLVGDNPLEAPVPVNHRVSFMELDECQAHLWSPKFQEEKASLQSTVMFGLLQRIEPGADSVPPTVAVTASCVTDNRI